MNEFLGHGRLYKGGRSTKGWKRGPRLENISQAPNGTLLWCVTHTRQNENLALVTEQRPLLPGVWARWAATDGTATPERDVFCIHKFMLEERHQLGAEYFFAVRDPHDHPDDNTCCTTTKDGTWKLA